MSEFNGFSEAAKLYAKNLPVIDAMRELYEAEIVRYLDTLAENVEQLIEDGSFQNSTTRGYRYWWIGEEARSEKYTHLWCKAKPPKLIPKKTFVMCVQAPTEPPERVEKVKQLVGKDSLPFVHPSRNPYAVVSAHLTCDEEDLDTPARQVVALLKELRRIDLETAQNA